MVYVTKVLRIRRSVDGIVAIAVWRVACQARILLLLRTVGRMDMTARIQVCFTRPVYLPHLHRFPLVCHRRLRRQEVRAATRRLYQQLHRPPVCPLQCRLNPQVSPHKRVVLNPLYLGMGFAIRVLRIPKNVGGILVIVVWPVA